MLENASNEEKNNHRGEDDPPTALAPFDDGWNKIEWDRIKQKDLQVGARCGMLGEQHDKQDAACQSYQQHD